MRQAIRKIRPKLSDMQVFCFSGDVVYICQRCKNRSSLKIF